MITSKQITMAAMAEEIIPMAELEAASAKYRAQLVANAEPAKSRGHITFTEHNGVRYELHQRGGEIWRAPVSNAIDVSTGYRIGRFESAAGSARQYLELFYPNLVSDYEAAI